VRVIAATNKDLDKLMREGKFREDLFYRLSVIPVYMPPLRERKVDIPSLARCFVEQFAVKNKKKIENISDDAFRLLMDYDWPGNIRELENAIERSVVVARGNIIQREDLPPRLYKPTESLSAAGSSLQENEKLLITRVISECDNNMVKAAKELGISRSTLYGKMKKLGIR
jgi:two-component system response regulator AtoC